MRIRGKPRIRRVIRSELFYIIYFTIPALHIEGGYGEIGDCSDLFKKSERAYEKNGNILHLGTLPAYVPEAIENLLYWVKNSELDMLVKSCVFHYEFELIHPFSDGNGRLGRLWHTLLLSLRNPLFAWLPIESIVHDNQDKYYASINKSNADGSGTAFAEFMLEIIKTALEEALSTSPQKADKDTVRKNAVIKYLKSHDYIMNADVQSLFGISIATANRILKSQNLRLSRRF